MVSNCVNVGNSDHSRLELTTLATDQFNQPFIHANIFLILMLKGDANTA